MLRTLLILSLTLAIAPALAQEADTEAAPAPATTPAAAPAAAPATTPVGDVARGKQLTYTCRGCHGVEGYKNAYPNFHVPKIGGQAPEYLSSALHEYKQGHRTHPTMQVQAQSFSDQDIADIAAFLSGLK